MIDRTRLNFVGGSFADRAEFRAAIGRIEAEEESRRPLECMAVWDGGVWTLEIARRYEPGFVAGGRLLQMPRDVRVELAERLAAVGLPMGAVVRRPPPGEFPRDAA